MSTRDRKDMSQIIYNCFIRDPGDYEAIANSIYHLLDDASEDLRGKTFNDIRFRADRFFEEIFNRFESE